MQARKELETYVHALRGILSEDSAKFGTAIEGLTTVTNEAVSWLDANPTGGKDKFEAKRKEVEAIANPVIVGVYYTMAGMMHETSGRDGFGPLIGDNDPRIEEVD